MDWERLQIENKELELTCLSRVRWQCLLRYRRDGCLEANCSNSTSIILLTGPNYIFEFASDINQCGNVNDDKRRNEQAK